MRLPVLSYDTGGISDIISHNKNGLLYPQKAWLELAQGMLEVSHNSALYKNLQNWPDQLDDFSYRAMLEKHEELYRKLIRKDNLTFILDCGQRIVVCKKRTISIRFLAKTLTMNRWTYRRITTSKN